MTKTDAFETTEHLYFCARNVAQNLSFLTLCAC
jgi:hypothetical protein